MLKENQLLNRSLAVISTSSATTTAEPQSSKAQRWIFGMIIGSAPFLAILVCWMFVSLCVNNLVRFYQRKRAKHYRNEPSTVAMDSAASMFDP